MKPSKMTVHSTKRLIFHARTLSCKLLTNMVQGAWGPWYVLYKRHVPQRHIPSHLVLFGTTHRGCGGYPSSDKNPLQRRWRDPTIYTRNGSSTAKIQSDKTRHSWWLYAHCSAKIAASIQWVQTVNIGVDKTPGKPANLGGIENDLPGILCCEKTRWSRPEGRRKTLWWFRYIQSCAS